jgi:hypothetical protein
VRDFNIVLSRLHVEFVKTFFGVRRHASTSKNGHSMKKHRTNANTVAHSSANQRPKLPRLIIVPRCY